jgi:hypothetical protein
MTRGDLKTSHTGSRTPFQILADYYQAGDAHDCALWREYGRVTRSLAAVRWSRGLRAAMLASASAHEKTDAEMAAEDVDGELVTAISVVVWSSLRAAGLEHAVLVAAENGGLEETRQLAWGPHPKESALVFMNHQSLLRHP